MSTGELLLVLPARVTWTLLKVIAMTRRIQVGDAVEVEFRGEPRIGVVTRVSCGGRRIEVVSPESSPRQWASSCSVHGVRKVRQPAGPLVAGSWWTDLLTDAGPATDGPTPPSPGSPA